MQNAILSGQDIILLGERGQAKSRIIRSLISLLDEYTPILEEIENPENPFAPASAQGKKVITEQGDSAPIKWLHREQRYGEVKFLDIQASFLTAAGGSSSNAIFVEWLINVQSLENKFGDGRAHSRVA